eukprot:m.205072 g.205072  ORF g.205072 m.205072 type:complete len:537 (-) comp22760_c0_seq1:559-2169(-)
MPVGRPRSGLTGRQGSTGPPHSSHSDGRSSSSTTRPHTRDKSRRSAEQILGLTNPTKKSTLPSTRGSDGAKRTSTPRMGDTTASGVHRRPLSGPSIGTPKASGVTLPITTGRRGKVAVAVAVGRRAGTGGPRHSAGRVGRGSGGGAAVPAGPGVRLPPASAGPVEVGGTTGAPSAHQSIDTGLSIGREAEDILGLAQRYTEGCGAGLDDGPTANDDDRATNNSTLTRASPPPSSRGRNSNATTMTRQDEREAHPSSISKKVRRARQILGLEDNDGSAADTTVDVGGPSDAGRAPANDAVSIAVPSPRSTHAKLEPQRQSQTKKRTEPAEPDEELSPEAIERAREILGLAKRYVDGPGAGLDDESHQVSSANQAEAEALRIRIAEAEAKMNELDELLREKEEHEMDVKARRSSGMPLAGVASEPACRAVVRDALEGKEDGGSGTAAESADKLSDDSDDGVSDTTFITAIPNPHMSDVIMTKAERRRLTRLLRAPDDDVGEDDHNNVLPNPFALKGMEAQRMEDIDRRLAELQQSRAS